MRDKYHYLRKKQYVREEFDGSDVIAEVCNSRMLYIDEGRYRIE